MAQYKISLFSAHCRCSAHARLPGRQGLGQFRQVVVQRPALLRNKAVVRQVDKKQQYSLHVPG